MEAGLRSLEKLTGFAQANTEDPDLAKDFTLLLKAGGVLGDYADRFLHTFRKAGSG